MYGDKLIRRKIIKKKRENVRNKWITWPLMWLNRSVVTINATLQLLDIYIYIYIKGISILWILVSLIDKVCYH